MLHTIQPKHKRRQKKIVGKGGRYGKTAGRGTKGQKSRSGRKIRPQIRDFIKKIPKLRGYDARYLKRKPTVELNFGLIEKHFKPGEEISKETLKAKGLIKTNRTIAKVLASDDLKNSYTFKGLRYSKKAKEKIIASGSKIVE